MSTLNPFYTSRGLMSSLKFERLVLACTPKFQGLLEAAREQIRETGGIGHKEFWQELEPETL